MKDYWQEQQEGLEKKLKLLVEQLNKLEEASVIETDVLDKFKLDKQIEAKKKLRHEKIDTYLRTHSRTYRFGHVVPGIRL